MGLYVLAVRFVSEIEKRKNSEIQCRNPVPKSRSIERLNMPFLKTSQKALNLYSEVRARRYFMLL